MKKTQSVRRALLLISLLLFPLTMNYLSPYISVYGAFQGIVAGSLLGFGALFLSGIFLGRAWCAWACPMGGLAEACLAANSKPAPVRILRRIRYGIFIVWAAALAAGFILAGGVRDVKPLLLTENGISVDEPLKYITYYLVILVFLALSLILGKRAACHGICWMAPFLNGGTALGTLLRIPHLAILSKPKRCTRCGTCTRNCPMGVSVMESVPRGGVDSPDCILCLACRDGCPAATLRAGALRGKLPSKP